MTRIAFPEESLTTSGGNCRWVSINGLGSKLGMSCPEVIKTGHYLPARANWAASTIRPITYLSHPFMPLTTLPTDLHVATGRDSFWIPSTSFCGQGWIGYRKGRLPSSSRHAHTLSARTDHLADADACDMDATAPQRSYRGRRTEDDALPRTVTTPRLMRRSSRDRLSAMDSFSCQRRPRWLKAAT
jgi:hypothetical protein